MADIVTTSSGAGAAEPAEPFPWHLGVFDAHCHPLEHAPSLAAAPTMKVRAAAAMATRREDQGLMHEAALRHGGGRGARALAEETRLVAGFGWHPWFSYQLYDDTIESTGSGATGPSPEGGEEEEREPDGEALDALKVAHYSAVLTPTPEPSFCLALETPLPLSRCLHDLRLHLRAHPLALVGEIGLDRAFRLPLPWTPALRAARPGGADGDPDRTPGGRERRPLSAQRVDAGHQRKVLRAQVRVAAEEGRAVSVHGVQAHGALYEEFRALWSEGGRGREDKGGAGGEEEGDEKAESGSVGSSKKRGGKNNARKRTVPTHGPFPPRICLHSFSGGVDALKPWFARSTPAAVYVSLSTINNFRASCRPSSSAPSSSASPDAGDMAAEARAAAVARWCPADRLLVESDLHVLGPRADDALEDAVRRVCALREWGLEEGVARLGRNFREFVLGPEAIAVEMAESGKSGADVVRMWTRN
jgi:Tat protein secretion system quality control protein TatD with DNase activity